VALVGFIGSPYLDFLLCFVVWGNLSLASNLQIQSLSSSIATFARS